MANKWWNLKKFLYFGYPVLVHYDQGCINQLGISIGLLVIDRNRLIASPLVVSSRLEGCKISQEQGLRLRTVDIHHLGSWNQMLYRPGRKISYDICKPYWRPRHSIGHSKFVRHCQHVDIVRMKAVTVRMPLELSKEISSRTRERCPGWIRQFPAVSARWKPRWTFCQTPIATGVLGSTFVAAEWHRWISYHFIVKLIPVVALVMSLRNWFVVDPFIPLILGLLRLVFWESLNQYPTHHSSYPLFEEPLNTWHHAIHVDIQPQPNTAWLRRGPRVLKVREIAMAPLVVTLLTCQKSTGAFLLGPSPAWRLGLESLCGSLSRDMIGATPWIF